MSNRNEDKHFNEISFSALVIFCSIALLVIAGVLLSSQKYGLAIMCLILAFLVWVVFYFISKYRESKAKPSPMAIGEGDVILKMPGSVGGSLGISVTSLIKLISQKVVNTKGINDTVVNINVSDDEDVWSVDILVSVNDDTPAHTLLIDVQKELKAFIKDMTGLEPTEINITITDIEHIDNTDKND